MLRRSFKLLPLLALSLSGLQSSFCPTAFAVETDYEKLGRQQYGNSNFKEAAVNFRLAIYRGSKSVDTWLLLAECYARGGENGAARQAYQTVQKYFPNTPQAAKAGEALSKLVRLPSSNDVKPVAVAPTAGQKPPVAGEQRTLRDRIYVVPPQFGHPAVEASTVQLVRTIISHLPKSIYKILDQGKTNVYITPNLIDRFPEAASTQHPTINRYFSEETGRTYGRDVYICERVSNAPGTTNLGPIMTDETIKNFTYTYLSHALNDCLELPSKDEQFVQLYKLDSANLDRSTDKSLAVFLDEREGLIDTFAALCASIMGSDGPTANRVSNNFPRCRAWIEKRVKILSER